MGFGANHGTKGDVAVLDVELHPTELGFQIVAVIAALVAVVVGMLDERQSEVLGPRPVIVHVELTFLG